MDIVLSVVMLLIWIGAVIFVIVMWRIARRIPPIPYTLEKTIGEGITQTAFPFGEPPEEPVGQSELPHKKHHRHKRS